MLSQKLNRLLASDKQCKIFKNLPDLIKDIENSKESFEIEINPYFDDLENIRIIYSTKGPRFFIEETNINKKDINEKYHLSEGDFLFKTGIEKALKIKKNII